MYAKSLLVASHLLSGAKIIHLCPHPPTTHLHRTITNAAVFLSMVQKTLGLTLVSYCIPSVVLINIVWHFRSSALKPDLSTYYLQYYWWEIIVHNIDITGWAEAILNM